MPLPGLIGVIGRISAGAAIALASRTLSHVVSGNRDDASATYNVTSSGQTRDWQGTILETWLPIGSSAASYQVKASSVSGKIPSSGDVLDVWLSLTQTRSWSIEAISVPSHFTGTIKVQIRDALSSSVVAEATIILDSQRTA